MESGSEWKQHAHAAILQLPVGHRIDNGFCIHPFGNMRKRVSVSADLFAGFTMKEHCRCLGELVEFLCDSHNSPRKVDDVTLGNQTTIEDGLRRSTQLQSNKVHDGRMRKKTPLKQRMVRRDLLTLIVDECHQRCVLAMAENIQQVSFGCFVLALSLETANDLLPHTKHFGQMQRVVKLRFAPSLVVQSNEKVMVPLDQFRQ